MFDHNSGALVRFDSNFDRGTRECHGNVLSLVLRLKVKWAKILICDKERVNGGTNHDSPGPRWVPKLNGMGNPRSLFPSYGGKNKFSVNDTNQEKEGSKVQKGNILD